MTQQPRHQFATSGGLDIHSFGPNAEVLLIIRDYPGSNDAIVEALKDWIEAEGAFRPLAEQPAPAPAAPAAPAADAKGDPAADAKTRSAEILLLMNGPPHVCRSSDPNCPCRTVLGATLRLATPGKALDVYHSFTVQANSVFHEARSWLNANHAGQEGVATLHYTIPGLPGAADAKLRWCLPELGRPGEWRFISAR